MPPSTVQSWVNSHLQAIPAIPFYAQKAKLEASKNDINITSLSQIIASDPGLSTQLFNLINAKRKGTKREYLESVHSALSLMGKAGISNFISKITTLDDIRSSFECEKDYLQLVARSQQAAKHAKQWGEKRKSQGIKEIGIATRLYDIAQFSLCLFDHDHFKQFKQRNVSYYNPDESCQKVLGFSLNQLSLALCAHFHLPDLVLEAHKQDEIAGIRSQGIIIASELVHHADVDWYQKETVDYLIKAADLCQLSLDKISSLAHLTCIESIRELEFDVSFHSASNLVQHKAPHRPKQPEAAPQTKLKAASPSPKITPPVQVPINTAPAQVKKQNPLLQVLKTTAQNNSTTQANQLNALLNGCHSHLNMARNALFLLSQDRSKISTRLHTGLDSDSPLLKFSMNKAQSGLLKILLEKPQAIWINPDNFLKYEKMLPGIFKACSRSNDFFMMSLFSGKKAVGIVFCDNNGNGLALSKAQFDLFKQAVGLTSKAMLLISQRTLASKN